MAFLEAGAGVALEFVVVEGAEVVVVLESLVVAMEVLESVVV